METLQEILQRNEKNAHKEYFTFLSFPSVSSEEIYKKDLLNCQKWLTKYIEEIGLKTEVWKTPVHPVIFASYEVSPDQPTLLIYNHYDVQPSDPLPLWETPPFEPRVKDGEVYARGAQDNKGQCFYVLQALKTLFLRDGKLPINIKLCIEGEEENGSVGLEAILESKREALKADYLAIVDLGIPSKDTPAITLGVRGIVTMDLEVEGSNVDLHSGSHGGAVFNPIHALVKLLNSLRDEQGKISVPGFYDAIVEMNQSEKEQIDFSFNEEKYRTEFNAEASGGEKTLPAGIRLGLRPTVEINGIWGGYTGDGFKTVIPAKAFAKISCRLVPNQDPMKIGQLVKDFLEKQAPKGLRVKVNIHPGGGPSARSNPSSKVVKAFSKAYSEVFQKPCRFILSGASIPIVTKLSETSGAETVLVGLGLPTDRIHAPNEHFGLDRIEKGTLIMARAIELLANTQKA